MSFRYVDRLEARRGEQPLWPGMKALSVLHRTGGMIRDPFFDGAGGCHRRRESERLDHLGDVSGERRDPRCLLGVGRVLPQHEAVIFDCGTATRCVDHDRVEPLSAALALPGIDVGAREGECSWFLTKMMSERPAAAAAGCNHDFATMPGQQPDRRFVNLGRQYP